MAGKRDRFARWMDRSGLLRCLEALPQQGRLLVVNYHRIGDHRTTDFDPEIFTIHQEGLASQVKALKERYSLLHLDEAMEIIRGKSKPRGLSVLLTFDDGYLDNMTLAVPVLKAYGATAVFFLVTGYLDNPGQIPWWDQIASITRRCVGRTIGISQPEPWSIAVTDENTEHVIRSLLARFRSDGIHEKLFFEELGAQTDKAEAQLPGTRLMMNWGDARQLLEEGMTIGLHTHTHAILSRLDEADQANELITCRCRLRQQLGFEAKVLAYPVGTPAAFTPVTKRLAREAGIEAAFSFYGGTNKPGEIDPFDVRRVAFPAFASQPRSRAAAALMAASGCVWF
jgi:peptidoglycan/xylan/chitin deacetylase (PgdA/CDA1 family)